MQFIDTYTKFHKTWVAIRAGFSDGGDIQPIFLQKIIKISFNPEYIFKTIYG